jgi:hypothetical protein
MNEGRSLVVSSRGTPNKGAAVRRLTAAAFCCRKRSSPSSAAERQRYMDKAYSNWSGPKQSSIGVLSSVKKARASFWKRLQRDHGFVKGTWLRSTEPTEAVCHLTALKRGLILATPTVRLRLQKRNAAPFEITSSSTLPSVG